MATPSAWQWDISGSILPDSWSQLMNPLQEALRNLDLLVLLVAHEFISAGICPCGLNLHMIIDVQVPFNSWILPRGTAQP